jgi:hypothetical protein
MGMQTPRNNGCARRHRAHRLATIAVCPQLLQIGSGSLRNFISFNVNGEQGSASQHSGVHGYYFLASAPYFVSQECIFVAFCIERSKYDNSRRLE